ncbi:hypothetical protein P389DRAFT_57862 [Cystobasidium minutum MCA 4210]|uniref:uncharacterized protein n=1 Tax=Cystobasidium minutum MCA 4210 TaxID=1397322 RepID=UPI0034CD595B|eukprot:jgi/Rhomi1/57862/CE57861_163
MEVNNVHEDGQREQLILPRSGLASSRLDVDSYDTSLSASSSRDASDNDGPAFSDPWHNHQSSSPRMSSIVNAAPNTSSIAQSSPPSASDTGSVAARRSTSSIPFFLVRRQKRRGTASSSPSSISSGEDNGQLHNISSTATAGQNHSLFVEDLPEFQPYSLFGSSSPHRRRFRSSPTVSYILRRRSNATTPSATTPPVGTPRRSLSHEASHNGAYAAIPNHSGTDRHQKKKQRWKSLLLASAILSIASAASPQASSRDKNWHKGESQPDMVQVGPSLTGFPSSYGSAAHSASAPASKTALSRKPSKLKKRPPKTLPDPVLLIRRRSTYNEWRRSMVMEVSADVSRRSSQRSKRSTVSRAASSSARTGASRQSTSRRALIRRGGKITIFDKIRSNLRRLLSCGGVRTRRSV